MTRSFLFAKSKTPSSAAERTLEEALPFSRVEKKLVCCIFHAYHTIATTQDAQFSIGSEGMSLCSTAL